MSFSANVKIFVKIQQLYIVNSFLSDSNNLSKRHNVFRFTLWIHSKNLTVLNELFCDAPVCVCVAGASFPAMHYNILRFH